MVSDKDVRRVLIICDKGYTEKADARYGGAGTESQIISSEIYGKVQQEKFIPVVREVDEDGEPFLPAYLRTRIYIDLSGDEKFHTEYDKLLRNVYERPALRKPPLGTPPAYIFEEEAPRFLTAKGLRNFKEAFSQERKIAKSLFASYLDSVLETLRSEAIEPALSGFVDDHVYSSIERLLPLRDELLECFAFIVDSDVSTDYFLLVHDFLGGLLKLTEDSQFTRAEHLDNFRFMQYEIFVSLISILLQKERIEPLEIFLDEDYMLKGARSKNIFAFNVFNRYTETLNDKRNQRLKSNRISLQADYLVERANTKYVGKDEFIEADFVLFLRSLLCPRSGLKYWYPRSVVHASQSNQPLDLFFKAQTPRHFEFMARLFKVSTVKELAHRLATSGHEQILRDYYWRSVHNLDSLTGIQRLLEIYDK